ncbi:MAG: hypothetical protein EHM48_01765 [Planctomycetaceae bacterium]|nr:MAG: hypothetical protein EHM48_01765 [Planctomycetaceae bacterium]
MTVQIASLETPTGLDVLTKGRRPLVKQNGDKLEMICNAQGFPVIGYRGDIAVHSLLRKNEWEELDRAVIAMVKLRLNGIQDLRDNNLVQPLGGLGTMVSQWNVGSEKVAASVSMDGRTRSNRDRVDKKLYGVPVPIIHQEYEIGARELESSRRLDNAIDTTEAQESSAAVSEKLENILFNGDSSVVVGGSGIYGYTTLAARTTATAAGFGGGDFGTISNILPTFLGMLSALSAKRYHGPFGCYISDTQYHQMLAFFTDGSGQTALDRVLKLPQIKFVKPSDHLADGATVMAQLTKNVVDLAVALDVTNREWSSDDGMALYFKVLLAMVPRLKTDYAGNAGVAHATAC